MKEEEEEAAIEPWDPFRDLWYGFRRDMIDPLRNAWGRFPMANYPEMWRMPRVDFRDAGNRYELTIEVPGIPKENVEIGVTDSRLEIRAKGSKEVEEEKEGYYFRESGTRAFYRTMTLPSDADHEKLEASMKDGILHVTIGKQKPMVQAKRRIPIH